eukprot:1128548-Rhodomonas_salina.2
MLTDLAPQIPRDAMGVLHTHAGAGDGTAEMNPEETLQVGRKRGFDRGRVGDCTRSSVRRRKRMRGERAGEEGRGKRQDGRAEREQRERDRDREKVPPVFARKGCIA